jgi:hypothetical protein
LYQAFDASFDFSPRGFVEEFVINARDNTNVLWSGHGEVDTLYCESEAFSTTNTTLTVEVLCRTVKDSLLVGEDVLVLLPFNAFFTVRENAVREEVDEIEVSFC